MIEDEHQPYDKSSKWLIQPKGYASSDPFAGDDVRHVVAFGGKTDVSALAGKPIVLRLHLKNAQFYSFAFRD